MVIFHLEKIAHRPKEGMSRKFSFGNCSRSSGSDHYRVDDGAVGGDHQEWGLTGQIISRLMFLVTHLGRTFLSASGSDPDPHGESGKAHQ